MHATIIWAVLFQMFGPGRAGVVTWQIVRAEWVWPEEKERLKSLLTGYFIHQLTLRNYFVTQRQRNPTTHYTLQYVLLTCLGGAASPTSHDGAL